MPSSETDQAGYIFGVRAEAGKKRVIQCQECRRVPPCRMTHEYDVRDIAAKVARVRFYPRHRACTVLFERGKSDLAFGALAIQNSEARHPASSNTVAKAAPRRLMNIVTLYRTQGTAAHDFAMDDTPRWIWTDVGYSPT
jgi:hypothetical protein